MTDRQAEAFADNLKKRIDEIENERKEREKELAIRQKYCNHIWVNDGYPSREGYLKTCRLCGKKEWFYDRD